MDIFVEAKKILEDYLGPAADRFIRRQIDFHLEKDPEDINREDVVKLSEWVRSSLGLITQDKKMVDEAAQRLAQLGHE